MSPPRRSPLAAPAPVTTSPNANPKRENLARGREQPPGDRRGGEKITGGGSSRPPGGRRAAQKARPGPPRPARAQPSGHGGSPGTPHPPPPKKTYLGSPPGGHGAPTGGRGARGGGGGRVLPLQLPGRARLFPNFLQMAAAGALREPRGAVSAVGAVWGGARREPPPNSSSCELSEGGRKEPAPGSGPSSGALFTGKPPRGPRAERCREL